MTGREPLVKTVEANGITIRYLEWPSEGTGIPRILLHNNRSVADVWRRFVDCSADVGPIYALDQRGCAGTSKPEDGYSVWDLAADVHGFIEALGLGRVHIIGCALGGSIGVAVAAAHPDEVAGLVMLDSGFPIEQEIIDRSVATLRATPHDFATREEAKQYVRTLPDSLGYSWSPVWEDYFDSTFEETPEGRWAFRYSQDGMIKATSHLSDDLWEDAKRVACPTCVVVGGRSMIVSEEDGRALAEVIPNSEFILLETYRHLMVLETNMELLVGISEGFLKAEAGM